MRSNAIYRPIQAVAFVEENAFSTCRQWYNGLIGIAVLNAVNKLNWRQTNRHILTMNNKKPIAVAFVDYKRAFECY